MMRDWSWVWRGLAKAGWFILVWTLLITYREIHANTEDMNGWKELVAEMISAACAAGALILFAEKIHERGTR